jgi:hypothetical protein
MPKDTQPPCPPTLSWVLPERVTVAVAELAGAAREDLLALAVRTRPGRAALSAGG